MRRRKPKGNSQVARRRLRPASDRRNLTSILTAHVRFAINLQPTYNGGGRSKKGVRFATALHGNDPTLTNSMLNYLDNADGRSSQGAEEVSIVPDQIRPLQFLIIFIMFEDRAL